MRPVISSCIFERKNMHVYNATELFDLHISGCFPLNIDFKSKSIPTELNASGNYLLFFDQELIYCGFAEKERAIIRFEKQLSTISLRGLNVSFNEAGKNHVATTSLHPIYSSALQQNEGGFETSIYAGGGCPNHFGRYGRGFCVLERLQIRRDRE